MTPGAGAHAVQFLFLKMRTTTLVSRSGGTTADLQVTLQRHVSRDSPTTFSVSHDGQGRKLWHVG